MNNNPQLPVNHEIALINGIATRISSAVPRKEETEASPCMVIIPGNPGDIGFYDIFISALFRAGNEKLPVYGVSHAGHAQVDEPSGPCSWTKRRDRDQPSSFTLDDQIEHKLAFLAYYILPKTRVILIGHSVGAYIALEVLKRYHDRSKILKCVLLFPTIERVDSSPSGRFWTFVSHYLHWPCLVATFLVSLLPSFAQRWTINWWMYLNSVENKQCITNATQSMLTYSTVRNMLEIGRQLVTIRELDQECIETNLDKLVFFYGLGDPWVPRCHYEDMKRRFPEGDVKLATDEHIQHAFVLDASEKVAQMVWEWIDENIV